jgi:pimeloyl-ACP methyl ester carboxylesterase
VLEEIVIGHTVIGHGANRVLVLHGWLGDWSIFTPMLPAIDVELFTFVFIDFRGFGQSLNIRGDFSLSEIAGDALELADHLGWMRFNVLGHSMGGAAALRLAVDAPARVERIVAATPVPASGVPLEGDARELFAGAAEKLEARQAIIDFTTGSRHCHAWSRELALRSWMSSKPDAFAAYFRAWSGASFAAEARRLEQPILVLVGEHDAGVTEAAMRATYLADYPNSKLKVLTNSGHYPMQEIPVAFASEVQAFLGQND